MVEKSTDGTLQVAREAVQGQANFQIVDNEVHRGKGYAVRQGMLRASGGIVFFMDADLSTPLDEVTKFLSHFNANPEIDVLVGNRKHPSSEVRLEQSVLRKKMGETFNAILRIAAGVSLRDTQCGFKAFRQSACRAIFERQTLDGFAFDVEILFLAERLGFRTADLPVVWVNSPTSKVSIIRDSLAMLRDALRVKNLVENNLRKMPQPAEAPR